MLSNFRHSLSEQYRFFRQFDKKIQLEIVAGAFASATTVYLSAEALFANVGFSCFTAITAGTITTLSFFEFEYKKVIRRERQETYSKEIKEYKEMVDEQKSLSNELLASAEAEANSNVRKRSKASVVNLNEDPEYLEAIKQINAKHKSNPQLNSILNATRVNFSRKKTAAANRSKAQLYAAEKIQALRSEISSLQDEEKEITVKINVTPNMDEQPSSNTTSCHIILASLHEANCFTSADTSANLVSLLKFLIGAGKNFIGAGSIIYAVMTTATRYTYTDPVVYMPTIATGLIASYFGGIRELHEHRLELKDSQDFKEFKNTMDSLLNKRDRIKNVNQKLNTIILDLNKDIEEDDRDEEKPANEVNETPNLNPIVNAATIVLPNQNIEPTSPLQQSPVRSVKKPRSSLNSTSVAPTSLFMNLSRKAEEPNLLKAKDQKTFGRASTTYRRNS